MSIRMEKSLCAILVIIITITMELSKAETSKKLYDRAKTFKRSDDESTTSEISVNFDRVLDNLLNYTDFQPFFISIGYFVYPSNINDLVTKYLGENPLNRYQFNLEKSHNNWHDLPIGLTWIILIDELETLGTKIIENPNFFNCANNFIIFLINERANETVDNLTNIFRSLWKLQRVYKVAITLMSENFRYVYGYSPFDKINQEFGIVDVMDIEEKNCNGQATKLNVTSSFRKNEKCFWQTVKKLKLFEDFHNLNGYSIHATVFESLMMKIEMNEKKEAMYQLLDGHVINLIEKRLNSKFIIKVLDVENEMDPFVEALKSINDGKSEFVFTGYFIKLYTSTFKFTSSISNDQLCLIAPSSKPVPKFFMPLLPFTKELWLLLTIYNFIIVLLWLFIRRIESTFHQDGTSGKVPIDMSIELSNYSGSKRTKDKFLSFKDFPHSLRNRNLKKSYVTARLRLKSKRICEEPPEINRWLVRFFDLTLSACSPLQGGKTCVERAFLFGTLFFGLIIIGLYQSYLVSSLSKPIFYPELKTLLDVAESNRTIITKYENLMHDVFTDGSAESERLRDKVKVSTSEEKTYDMVAYKGVISLGRFSSFELENLTKYRDIESNRMLLHMVEECATTYSLAYVARFNSPFLARVDDLLLIMQQAGLINLWYNDMLRTGKIVESKTSSKRRDKRVKLTLEHLSLTFLGLGIGLFCCTLVFLGELHHAKKFPPFRFY